MTRRERILTGGDAAVGNAKSAPMSFAPSFAVDPEGEFPRLIAHEIIDITKRVSEAMETAARTEVIRWLRQNGYVVIEPA